MTDLEEDEIAREIERDLSAQGSLVALALCLVAVAGLVIAGASAFFNAG